VRFFVDTLATRPPTFSWRWPQSCHLLSDNMLDLRYAASRLGLHLEWMRWSRTGTPFFLLTPYCRTRALLLGGIEITRYELRLLIRLWHMRSLGSLAHIADASHRPPGRNPLPLPNHVPMWTHVTM
jgi:hypothetical protein